VIPALGILSSFLFAICALPQLIECIKQKHAKGVNALFLLLWAGGELSLFGYV